MFVALLLSQDQASRKYSGPDLPSLIRDVVLYEFDLSPVDFELEEDEEFEYPPEFMQVWKEPTPDNLLKVLGYLQEELLLVMELGDPAPAVSH